MLNTKCTVNSKPAAIQEPSDALLLTWSLINWKKVPKQCH